MRTVKLNRKTKETDIRVELNLDGDGKSQIKTGIGFFDHMLTLFSNHSMVDMALNAKGDLEVDDHHTIEDIGFVLGQAFDKALAERKGINRYGFCVLPMDEALAQVAIDLGGRPFLQFEADFSREKVGEMSTELVYDFFDAFCRGCKANISIRLLAGRNDHHKIESIFKAFARAMRMACELDPRQKRIPSTKGVL
ncbi:imidazoleglycerol-phosphate dehydratase HisB [Candidatus Micrarchaeota archaeon]|nr:imidazoleglycerol-phosphate dehydratase HisB [Candidatus Micrarchaeota archaeon]MBU1165591.1 imidazoleglycerol-phosphate dehydratase HisB [Candidatus Micrarchaeota archaeon]MBU1887402.1 imidazoleglycerol-phosphate dehydratase HisB [Candidatus Micrarchaeota archaeon]